MIRKARKYEIHLEGWKFTKEMNVASSCLLPPINQLILRNGGNNIIDNKLLLEIKIQLIIIETYNISTNAYVEHLCVNLQNSFQRDYLSRVQLESCTKK